VTRREAKRLACALVAALARTASEEGRIPAFLYDTDEGRKVTEEVDVVLAELIRRAGYECGRGGETGVVNAMMVEAFGEEA
jgi:tetrahydromethanopterin S-methyltransferase subunit G